MTTLVYVIYLIQYKYFLCVVIHEALCHAALGLQAGGPGSAGNLGFSAIRKLLEPGSPALLRGHLKGTVPLSRNLYRCRIYFFSSFFFNVYLFFWGQRETEHERGRGRERGRHRIRNRLQAPSHQPRARRGARTHGPRDRDLAEVGHLTDCATQAPLYY